MTPRDRQHMTAGALGASIAMAGECLDHAEAFARQAQAGEVDVGDLPGKIAAARKSLGDLMSDVEKIASWHVTK